MQGQCSPLSDKFGGENRWVFRPCVSQRSDDCGLFEAGSPEFIEECTCIPCASDSRKPIGSARPEMLGQRCSEDQLRTGNMSAWTNNPSQFVEYVIAKRVEVKNPID
jgi:hypothetical protein